MKEKTRFNKVQRRLVAINVPVLSRPIDDPGTPGKRPRSKVTNAVPGHVR